MIQTPQPDFVVPSSPESLWLVPGPPKFTQGVALHRDGLEDQLLEPGDFILKLLDYLDLNFWRTHVASVCGC